MFLGFVLFLWSLFCTNGSAGCQRLPQVSGRTHSYRTVDDEPTTIPDESRHSQRTHEGENRTPGEEMKRRRQGFNGADAKHRRSCDVSAQNSSSSLLWFCSSPSLGTQDGSRAGVAPLFGGLRETQTNLADAVVPCWLDSPCCDLNLFCLDYKVPSGQLMQLKGAS